MTVAGKKTKQNGEPRVLEASSKLQRVFKREGKGSSVPLESKNQSEIEPTAIPKVRCGLRTQVCQ